MINWIREPVLLSGGPVLNIPPYCTYFHDIFFISTRILEKQQIC